MRKTLLRCILALGLALGLLAGCGGVAPPSSASPEPALSDAPLLLAMRESLLAEGAVFRVDFVTLGADRRVAIDAELLEGVAGALCVPAARRIDDVRSIADAEHELMLQGGDPWTGVYLYLLGENSDPAGPATLLVLQVGEESAHYLYGPETFEAVAALVDARTVENTVALEGEHLPLSPAQDDAIPQECYVQAWAEADGVLAAAYHWYPSADSGATAGAVELFDAATGESLLVALTEGGPERLEAGDWQGFDLRAVLEGGSVLYLNSQSLETKTEHPLPDALLARLDASHTENRPYYFSFDQHPASGTAAITDGEGLHWQWAGGAGSLLNDDIPLDILAEDRRKVLEENPQGFSPVMLDDVRVMNGGNTLVAAVVIPGSQIGITGHLALDLPTGEPHWYANLYHLPMVATYYPDDTTVVARSEPDQYRIELAGYGMTHESVPEPMRERVVTVDLAHFLTFDFEMLPDGSTTTVVHTGDAEKPLLVATGASFHYTGITPHYALFRSGGGFRSGLVAVKYA